MADLVMLALTVFFFSKQYQNRQLIYIYWSFFALLLVFFLSIYKCLSLPPPLLGGAISKPLTLPFALAFRTSYIETVV